MERRTLIKVTARRARRRGAAPRRGRSPRPKYRIGFSQATILETWRVQFNKDMKREAEKHPEIELIIADGQNKTEKQVADVENFISQGVDVLIVSPKESAGLTPVVEKAIDAGIPVIILDRNVNTDRITQFIGGDNVVIGRAAGEYAVKLLGGPGNAKGNVVEIWGGFASAPAHDRSTGFHEVTDKEPGSSTCWPRSTPNGRPPRATRSWRPRCRPTRTSTSSTPTTIRWPTTPTSRPRTPAARRASSSWASTASRTRASPGSTRASWTRRSSTPRPGAEGIRQALKLLNGEKIEKKITLPTMTITKDNAAEIIKANG